MPAPNTPAVAPAPAARRTPPIAGGKRIAPSRILIYGTPGVGKTRFGADAGVHFIDLEDGSGEFDCQRLGSLRSEEYVPPRTLDEVEEILDFLIYGEHTVKAIAIDTLDKLEAMIHAKICLMSGKDSIEGFGFGKGFQIALDELRRILARLDELRAKRGIPVLIFGHAVVRTFKNPEGEDFDRFQLKTNQLFAGAATEWCDVLGFASFELATQKPTKDAPRAKGVTTGHRILRLQREGAFDAKTRYDMPTELPFAWAEFSKELRAAKARSATNATSPTNGQNGATS